MRGCYLAAAFSLLPAETFTPLLAAIWMVAPVAGLRPARAARCVCSNAIQPGMATLVPSPTDFATTEKKASTTPETAAWLWPDSAAMAATRSFLLSDLSAMGVLLGPSAFQWTQSLPDEAGPRAAPQAVAPGTALKLPGKS